MRLRLVFVGLLLAGPALAQAPGPAASISPASPLDNYAEAATTAIIAEQACPGVQVRAGQLTTLRLGARVNPGRKPCLRRSCACGPAKSRQQLAADGREAWCEKALAAFGPKGSVAKGVLATGSPVR
ncbi:hypothetical protein ACU4GR_29765 [Methylobacterium oryzae CBMB20]